MTALTTAAGQAFARDVQAFDPAQVIPDALIMQTATFTVPVEGDAVAVRVPYIDADADAGFVAEGGAITEAAPDTSAVVIATGKVAVLGRISREAYSQDNIPNLISTSFQRAVIKKANNAYLNQAKPTAPAISPPAGLLNLSPTSGGSVAANLDAIADAVATVETAFGAATHILANPKAWAALLKLKVGGTDTNQSLLGAGTSDAVRSLLSVPVLTSAAMPANTLLILDKASILSSYGPVTVAVSDQAFFASDSIALRVTWRFGAKIVDTSRVVKLTIT